LRTLIVDNVRVVNDVKCRFKKYGLRVGVVLASLFVCNLAKAKANVSLNWDANPDPSVAGYKVYYGGASGNYTNVINAGNTTGAAVSGLVEGQTYYFAVTAYTYDGLESNFSDESAFLAPGLVTLTPGATPDAPIQIRFPTAVGHSYDLQESTDLKNWVTVWQTEGFANDWVEFDGPVNPSGALFYRVMLH